MRADQAGSAGVIEGRQALVASAYWRQHDVAIMSTRTRITMVGDMQRRAHAKAAELGISFAEYVRRLVASDLGQPRPRANISMVFDLGASREPTDIARDKDRMVGDAVWKEHLRKTATQR
jgi:hypothetical protein